LPAPFSQTPILYLRARHSGPPPGLRSPAPQKPLALASKRQREALDANEPMLMACAILSP